MSHSRHLRRVVLGSTAALAAAGLLAGCSTTAEPPQQPQSNSNSSAPTKTGNAQGDTANDPRNRVHDAIAVAKKKIANGTVVSAEWEDRIQGFEVKVVEGSNKHKLAIDSSGKVLSESSETDADDAAKAQRATVDIDSAITNALNQKKGFVFNEAGLDDNNGKLQWEIELYNGANNQEKATLKIDAER